MAVPVMRREETMRLRTFGLVAAVLVTAAAPLAAQRATRAQEGPRREAAMRMQRPQQGMRGGAGGAEQFLARTGELGLTDQQVVRLAAIARRAEARRVEQRAAMPAPAAGMRMGMRAGGTPADSATRAARMAQMQGMQARMQAMRESREADLKDAIAILTPEQQAKVLSSRMRRGGM